MSWLRNRRCWIVCEVAHYTDPARETNNIRETGLTERQARRSAAEWQAASDHNRLMVELLVDASKRKPLPHVAYLAERAS